MVSMRLQALSLLCVFSLFVHSDLRAEDSLQKVIKCPKTHPKYEELRKKLETFTQQVSKDPDCQDLNTNLVELSRTYRTGNRSVLNGIDAIKNKQVLEPNELKEISEYTTDLTSTVGNIVDLLGNPDKDKCLNQKKTPTLLTIAEVTQEVTSIASNFSGPYGAAISVGGAAIGGILKGIHSIIQKSKRGYDLEGNEAHRDLFAANLCTYHGIRQEIEEMIEPGERFEFLELLAAEMQVKRKALIDPNFDIPDLEIITMDKIDAEGDGRVDGVDCRECRYLDSAAQNALASYRDQVKFSHSLRKIEELIPSANPFEVCTEIAHLAHKSVFDMNNEGVPEPFTSLETMEDECATGENALPRPFCQEWVQLIQDSRAWSQIPHFRDCMRADLTHTQMREINDRSIAVIKGIGKLNEYVWNRLYSELEKLGEQKYMREQGLDFNPVKYIRKTWGKIVWIDKELALYREMQLPQNDRTRKEITRDNIWLHDLFFEDLAPRFLGWQVEDARKALKSFERQSSKVASELREYFFPRRYNMSLAQVLAELVRSEKTQNDDRAHQYAYSRIDRLMATMNLAQNSLGPLQVYCDFFHDIKAVTRDLVRLCSGKRHGDTSGSAHAQLSAELAETNEILGAIQGYMEWAKTEGKVNGTKLEKLLEKVRTFRTKLVNRGREEARVASQ